MSEMYYTQIPLPEEKVGEERMGYAYMDIAKPFNEMLRVTPEPPQGDGKTTEPYYLDPPTFWDKVSEMYIDSL